MCRFTWVQLGFLGMVVCTREAGRPSPAWSTLGPLCSQKWWARKRPAALAANHGLIFKFVAQDPRIRTHHSGRDKNSSGNDLVNPGFLLTRLLFFALFEYKPGWVQHEGPSLVLFYIGTVARIQSGESNRAAMPRTERHEKLHNLHSSCVRRTCQRICGKSVHTPK